ncbi:amino acid ABC transporter substrate-binding protein [Aquabacter cavernae]|uniref:amino acid ABC transporter substrate-binding protein n=1 Tax=Aquabacter cavernae TaxID=2496029 RepID=UPI000F8E7484|nr:amino acid ABC transporter substrate-binding protein [Aquabacter cavernae]
MTISRRKFVQLASTAGLAVAAPAVWTQGQAQSRPLRVGASFSLTGPLSATKAGLVGLQIWRDDVNAAGGLLGRQVELVTYDDQSTVAQIPSIYSKLVDIDKVDVLISPYGAVLSAPVMPFIKQRGRFMVGMFALAGNDGVKSDRYFHSAPWGPDAKVNWARGFFEIGKANGCKRIAILNADVEFAKVSAAGGKAAAKELGQEVVFEQSYPPNTSDFSAILRNLRAATPDAVFVCSYPPDSSALVRGLSEVGVGDSVKLFGGGMVGPQYAANLQALGPALNGIVNFNLFVPEPTMVTPQVTSFLERYTAIAVPEKLDPLGFYIPPFYYVAGQLIAQAVKGAGSTDSAAMAAYLHANPTPTLVGNAQFNEMGDWTERRVLMTQFQGIKGNDIEQFRQPGRQVILDPSALKSGDLIQPFMKARAA